MIGLEKTLWPLTVLHHRTAEFHELTGLRLLASPSNSPSVSIARPGELERRPGRIAVEDLEMQ